MDEAPELDLRIEYHSGIPVYRQIIHAITAAIERGGLAAGDRLPTIRQLSERLAVNPNTVAKAYRELELTRVLETHGRNGSQVSDHRPQARELPPAERLRKLEQIWATALAEARAHYIPEADLRAFIAGAAVPTTKRRRI